MLSFLQVSTNAAVVLQWFVNLVTASQLINFSVMAYTFIAWKRACDAQGLDRKSLPHTSIWQPFSAWYALTGCFIMTFVGGYTVFLPGYVHSPKFTSNLSHHLSIFLFPAPQNLLVSPTFHCYSIYLYRNTQMLTRYTTIGNGMSRLSSSHTPCVQCSLSFLSRGSSSSAQSG
jgi:Amino acid permease